MKMIKAFFGDWHLVTDEYADMFVNRMYERSPCGTKENIRKRHTKECKEDMTLSKDAIIKQWMFLVREHKRYPHDTYTIDAGSALYSYAEKHYGFEFTDKLDQIREEHMNGK